MMFYFPAKIKLQRNGMNYSAVAYRKMWEGYHECNASCGCLFYTITL
jgi:hypothetical protein